MKTLFLLVIHVDISSVGPTSILKTFQLFHFLHKKGKKARFNSISRYEPRLSKVKNEFFAWYTCRHLFWAIPYQFLKHSRNFCIGIIQKRARKAVLTVFYCIKSYLAQSIIILSVACFYSVLLYEFILGIVKNLFSVVCL